MRISDWSSDVCSSDLRFDDAHLLAAAVEQIALSGQWEGERVDAVDGVGFDPGELYLTLARWTSATEAAGASGRAPAPSEYVDQIYFQSIRRKSTDLLSRSDERRVGKECVSTGRSRGSAYTEKKQNKKYTNKQKK